MTTDRAGEKGIVSGTDLESAAGNGFTNLLNMMLKRYDFAKGDMRNALEAACCAQDDISAMECILDHLKLDAKSDLEDQKTSLAVACVRDDVQQLDEILDLADATDDFINSLFYTNTSCVELTIIHRSHNVLKRLLEFPELDLELRTSWALPLVVHAALKWDLAAVKILSAQARHPPVKYEDLRLLLNAFQESGELDTPAGRELVEGVIEKSVVSAEEIRDFQREEDLVLCYPAVVRL